MLNCYRHHGRDDLLPTFTEEEEAMAQTVENEKKATLQHQFNLVTAQAHQQQQQAAAAAALVAAGSNHVINNSSPSASAINNQTSTNTVSFPN